MNSRSPLTTEMVLRAYAHGIFPMAERRDDPGVHWLSPEIRGILPFESFHVPRRLARTVRGDRFVVTSDSAFVDVIRACAEPSEERPVSWINDPILQLYTELHAAGHAHSIECWQQGMLVGGLYGVNLGGAFFGESMFSRARDASKVALVHLMAGLKSSSFVLVDTQFLTSHLVQFGAIEVPRDAYLARLAEALQRPCSWPSMGAPSSDPMTEHRLG